MLNFISLTIFKLNIFNINSKSFHLKMQGGLNKICANHQWQNPNFFCFDDQQFLCDACFKDHKWHNIETISEIQKTENFYKSLLKKNLLLKIYMK